MKTTADRGLDRRSAAIQVGAVVCALWCWWLLSFPWLLGAEAWTVVVPWLVFAGGWAILVLPSRVRRLAATRVASWVVAPCVLFAVTLVGAVAHLPLVVRVAVSQQSLLRAAAVASTPNPPEQRAGLFTVKAAYREAGTGGTIILLAGGFLGDGAVEHLPRGAPRDEPDDDWSDMVQLYGPWWARASPIP